MTHRRATAIVALAVLAGLFGCAAGPVDVTGRVLGDDGEPRAGCPVIAQALSGGPIPEVAQVSGSDGRYSWSFPGGRYEITAYCDTDETGSVTVGASTPEGGSTDIVVGE